MNNTPKISIIIPAYNAEAFISSTIDSFLAQTYPNFELTVVDDGSLDSTESILNAYTAQDERIKILRTSNVGPANARNLALESLDNAVDYIMFSDADDWVDNNILQNLLDSALNGADFVISGFSIINATGRQQDYFEPDASFNRNTIGSVLGRLYSSNLLNTVCGKLFRHDIIQKNKIRFPDYRWGEDRIFVFNYLSRSNRVVIQSFCGYKYIMRNTNSLVTAFWDDKVYACKQIDIKIRELCEKYDVKDDVPFHYMFVKSIFSCMHNLFLPNCRLNHNEKREYIRSILNDQYVLERCKCKTGNNIIRLICIFIRSRNITLNMAAARFSVIISMLFPRVFRRIKHKKY